TVRFQEGGIARDVHLLDFEPDLAANLLHRAHQRDAQAAIRLDVNLELQAPAFGAHAIILQSLPWRASPFGRMGGGRGIRPGRFMAEIWGDLSLMPVADLVIWFANRGANGVLNVELGNVRKEFTFSNGACVRAASTDPREYFGQFL